MASSLKPRLAMMLGKQENEIGPGHIRGAGAYCLLAVVVIAVINVSTLRSSHELYPKTVAISPAILLLGLWLLLDAKAVAEDRRSEGLISAMCVGVGTALGLWVVHRLTGSWFPVG